MIMNTEKKTCVLVHGAWHGGWFRAYGNEQWEFDTNGLMRRREASTMYLFAALTESFTG
jgi:nuclear transport factor 2 (NTF2) superfamily protein